MNKTVLILIVFLFALVSCNKSSNYNPQGLRKLSNAELIERARARNYISENTVFRDSIGNIISRDELHKMNPEESFGDQYVNSENELVEVVIRKATIQDKELFEKMKEAFEVGESIGIIDIDCAKIQKILENVYDTDQGNRQGESLGNSVIVKKNQQIVVSTIENCGFPSVDMHGYKSVQAVFLVIQHAAKNLREKYFPLIKKSADKGDLSWSTVALMEDRMLMDRGEKQKVWFSGSKEEWKRQMDLVPD